MGCAVFSQVFVQYFLRFEGVSAVKRNLIGYSILFAGSVQDVLRLVDDRASPQVGESAVAVFSLSSLRDWL